MKLTVQNLAAVKTSLAGLAAVAIAGAGAIYWTSKLITQTERALAAQENQLKEARSRFQRSGDERNLIERYSEPYRQLHAQGLIGPERRINWLDALRLANQQAQLFGAEYKISTQQAYPHAQELGAAQLGLAQSLMTLSLRLAHEGELMRFFRLLSQQNAGMFDINECVLERLGTTGTEAVRLQPNLRAECELAWVTINPEPSERKP